MTAADEIFQRFRGKPILLDANLLLLYLIGTFQRERIPVFKRTASFTMLEFDQLVSLLTQFRIIVTTPHILTEVSNLANALPEYLKSSWSEHFSERVMSLHEVWEPATRLVEETAFNPFGLADAAIQSAAKDILVLTEDFRLSRYLATSGILSLNFRDLTMTLGF